MNYRYLGKTGVRVSPICLGTMTFGNEADEATSRTLMDHAFDSGINFFDTADAYSRGASEEIIGRWWQDKREQIVLATKVHFPSGEGVNERGSSRLHIMRGAEASLRRLQTDHVDILYLHHWDAHTAIEESLLALNDLVRQGKVLYCGVSNFSAWQTMKAICAADVRGFAPVSVIQPQYNLVKRIAEVEILPMAADQGLGVCPYSPMAAGLLTGKYLRNEDGRITRNKMYAERYKAEEYYAVSERFARYAEEKGCAPPSLAVAWVMHHPAVTSAIVGARDMNQLPMALTALDIAMTPEMRAAISALAIEPPTATDRERTGFQPTWKK